ncbi:MAG: PIG-L family deacetylase [Kofleriaceae bacterium]|nr:PIG-L family deacetylase [Kofleriaceae bacterium]
MTRYLYLSPHLDDVILSAGATIASRLEAGDEVAIVTVFSGNLDSSNAEEAAVYGERRAEDKKAISLLSTQSGALYKTIYLGLADAPFRDSKYTSFEAIVNSPVSGDDEIGESLKCRVGKMLEIERPDVLVTPLGVGRHVDHRLVFEAIATLAWQGESRFYQERPYAFVPGAVDLRWSSLGARPIAFGTALPAQEYPEVSFLAGYRKESEMCTEVREVLVWRWNNNAYCKYPVAPSKPQRRRRLLAIAAYKSQLAALFDSEAETAEEAIAQLYGSCPEVEWQIHNQSPPTGISLSAKEK